MTRSLVRRLPWLAPAAVLAAGAGRPADHAAARDPNAKAWVQLFNGRDLSGWDVKFAKHDLGDNFNDTFRVEHGMLEVRYLAASEWATGGEERIVRILLHGLSGPVEVAGETYSGAMPPWGGALDDAQIAAVTTYVRGSWGNKASPIAPATVARIRAATAARKAPWTAAELAQVR